MDGRTVSVDENGVVSYRASALGGDCTRALVYGRLGYDERPWPKDMQDRADEGHAHEELVLAKMAAEGWTIWDRQLEVVLMVSGKIRVVGHIDGKGIDNVRLSGSYVEMSSKPHIVEVKSQSKDQWNDFEARGWDSGYFPHYKWQVSCYMLATGLPLVMVRKNRNDGRIKMEWVDEPFYDLRDIRSRVLSVEVLAADGIGPDECGPGRIYPCPFFYMPGHDGPIATTSSRSGKVPVERRVVAGEEAREIEHLARRYELARQNEASARMAKDESRKALEIAGEGTSGLDLDTGTRVTFWSQRAGPRRLSKEMEERLRLVCLWYFGVDIDQYREQAEGRRMKVTLREEEEKNE